MAAANTQHTIKKTKPKNRYRVENAPSELLLLADKWRNPEQFGSSNLGLGLKNEGGLSGSIRHLYPPQTEDGTVSMVVGSWARRMDVCLSGSGWHLRWPYM